VIDWSAAEVEVATTNGREGTRTAPDFIRHIARVILTERFVRTIERDMELRTFVKEALVQIIDGVVDASEHARSKDAWINPRMAEERRTVPIGKTTKTVSRPDPNLVEKLGVFLSSDNRVVDMVDFDVAVTASTTGDESTSLQGGVGGNVGIKVVSIDVGGKSESSTSISRTDERVSHVRFRIPLALPQFTPPAQKNPDVWPSVTQG